MPGCDHDDWKKLQTRLQSSFPFLVSNEPALGTEWQTQAEFPEGVGYVTDMEVDRGVPQWKIRAKKDDKVRMITDFQEFAKVIGVRVGEILYKCADSEETRPIGTLIFRHGNAKDKADALEDDVLPCKSEFVVPDIDVVEESSHSSRRRATNFIERYATFVSGEELDFRTEDMTARPKKEKRRDESDDGSAPKKRGPGRPKGQARSAATRPMSLTPSRPSAGLVAPRRRRSLTLMTPTTRTSLRRTSRTSLPSATTRSTVITSSRTTCCRPRILPSGSRSRR